MKCLRQLFKSLPRLILFPPFLWSLASAATKYKPEIAALNLGKQFLPTSQNMHSSLRQRSWSAVPARIPPFHSNKQGLFLPFSCYTTYFLLPTPSSSSKNKNKNIQTNKKRSVKRKTIIVRSWGSDGSGRNTSLILETIVISQFIKKNQAGQPGKGNSPGPRRHPVQVSRDHF